MGRNYAAELRQRGQIVPGSREARRALRACAESWLEMSPAERAEFFQWTTLNPRHEPRLPERVNAASLLGHDQAGAEANDR